MVIPITGKRCASIRSASVSTSLATIVGSGSGSSPIRAFRGKEGLRASNRTLAICWAKRKRISRAVRKVHGSIRGEGQSTVCMCGIAGYFLIDDLAQTSVVRSMCDQIRHRGPDDDGYHAEGPCAIGMRRLSIIDLTTGHQPIANEDGSVWVVFNGEIYDYQELRARLIAQGHTFRTHSDTEVLVHLY